MASIRFFHSLFLLSGRNNYSITVFFALNHANVFRNLSSQLFGQLFLSVVYCYWHMRCRILTIPGCAKSSWSISHELLVDFWISSRALWIHICASRQSLRMNSIFYACVCYTLQMYTFVTVNKMQMTFLNITKFIVVTL
jgi:hypothetical protein